jgi:hypothetical protein
MTEQKPSGGFAVGTPMPTRAGTAVGKWRSLSNQQTLQEKHDGRNARDLEKSGKHVVSQPALGT